ncbi:hypothetical protein N7449_008734 [Penicillium cf. viridicatum]|uniref:Uncharacterized protein n=1 Tax=Penicillium cf. viridicatum TaxID=2972119 RepID=A0A9W9MA02_9EURO|nr:hypothetical protein N7449_008734 [Penicillium cf. viridicatum]
MSESRRFLEPLPLNYSLAKRKLRILMFWLLVLFDSFLLPIGLYYLLTRTTTWSSTTIFTVLTTTLFGTFVTESLQRSWDLWRKNSTCRVPNFDFTHWNILVSWVIIIAELVVGTVPDPPWMRILAMPVSSIFLVFALEMLVFELMYIYELPAPFRISSVPKGEPMRPALYPLLEDIIAVDGKGGTRFRDRLDQRYKSSPPFRSMMHRVTMLWAVPLVVVAGGTLAGVFIADRELAYTLGWSVPVIWAGIWVVLTVIWIRVELRRERHYWRAFRLTRELQGQTECNSSDTVDTIEEEGTR